MKRIHFSILGAILLWVGCGQDNHEGHKHSAQGLDKKIAWRDLSSLKDTVNLNEEHTWNFVYYSVGTEPVRIKQALPGTIDCKCKVPDKPTPGGEQDTVKLICRFPEPGHHSVVVLVEHDTKQSFPSLVMMTYARDSAKH